MVTSELPIAFVALEEGQPELEIRVNFGVFAGREATPAELDELGHTIKLLVEHVTLVLEHRHELNGDSETSLHQVRIAIPKSELPDDAVEVEWMRDHLVGVAERWARECIDSRHAEVIELFPGVSPNAF